MAIPLKVTNCPAGTLEEFQNGSDSVDNIFVSSASVLQHEALLNHDNILNVGTNTHAMLDTSVLVLNNHLIDSTVHFTVGSIDHTAINNIGTNSHALIDSHISNGSLHFLATSIDHDTILNVGTNTHAVIDSHIGNGLLHFTEASIDHDNIINGSLTEASGHWPVPYVRVIAEALPVTNTTAVAPVTHLNINVTPVVASQWKLSWSFSYSRNNTGTDCVISIIDLGGINGLPPNTDLIYQLVEESKDAAGIAHAQTPGTMTDQRKSASGFAILDLPAGFAQNVNMTINSSNAGVIASIWNARMELLRIA